MSEPDKYDKEAALLVCTVDFPVDKTRDRVAAALREAAKDRDDLRRKVECLQHENSQAKDAIAQLSEGKLLGELAGKQTIVNMAREIMRLKHDIIVAGEMYEDAQDEIAELKMELDDLKGNSTYD